MNTRHTALATLTASLVASGCATTTAWADSPDSAPPSVTTHHRTPGVNTHGMSPNATMAPLAASTANQRAAFNYFVGKGLTKIQAAAIVGNLMQESGVDPTAVQYPSGPGRGIAQWSVGGRWNADYHDNMTWYASAYGLSRWSLSAQLAFTWYELRTFSYYGLGSLRSANNLTSAVTAFERHFEGCGDCRTSTRIAYARQVYNRYASSAAAQSGAFAVTPSSSASSVRALQHLLSAYGIYTTADGSYGPATTASVRTYQARHGLTQTGQADTATMTSLTGGTSVRVVAGWPNRATVRAVQLLLVAHGYATSSPVDGTFDARDVAEVKRFQSAHQLAADGVVGPATWRALFVA